MANNKPIVEIETNTEGTQDTVANVKVLENNAQASIVRKEQERKNLANFYLNESKIKMIFLLKILMITQ